ncbi:MAG: GNAT family protein [Anaerolineae bacterium]|nr:GNAT family protein [Anaerolineae bacterium]
MYYGDRIRLRAIEREDLPTFVRWFNDPEVRRYLMMYEPMSMAKEERWFQGLLERRDEHLFCIEAAAGDQWVHIGNCGLHKIDWKNRNAEFGIAIGEKAYWGKGYGTDAARTMLRFAFHELNLHRVELEVFDHNARARRCYEKAGYRLEGTRRHALYRDGQYHDVHVMSILRHEFAEGEEQR